MNQQQSAQEWQLSSALLKQGRLRSSRMNVWVWFSIVVFLSTMVSKTIDAFLVIPERYSPRGAFSEKSIGTRTTSHLMSEQSQNDLVDDVSTMRVKQIKLELQERKVSFDDCFDKESLVERLLQARESPQVQEASATATTSATSSDNNSSDSDKEGVVEQNTNTKLEFDRQAVLTELRGYRLKELKEECGRRQIRWAKFLEKEDFVQALVNARETASGFSISGMTPGQVKDMTDVELELELSQVVVDTPLLLDVYATWCGPCKLMAPQLDLLAQEYGDRLRVAKLDSDQYPELAGGRFHVQGLPTILLLNGNQELKRVEGALMKDQLKELVDPFLQHQ